MADISGMAGGGGRSELAAQLVMRIFETGQDGPGGRVMPVVVAVLAGYNLALTADER
jgi:hypothetical protein